MVGGALVLTASAWLFGGIAEDVVEGDAITLLDAQIATWLHLHAVSPLTRVMLGVSHVHGIVGVSVLTALVGVYLLWRRDRYWFVAFVFTVPVGMIVNSLVKLAFHRARPSFDDPVVTLTTFSFPERTYDGYHRFLRDPRLLSAGADPGTGRQIAIVGAAILMIVLVAMSRIYLGAHFLSDVLAAIALGIAWVALCLMATATLERRRALRGEPAP
jgi:undecaprenyl-diphosphatase